MVKGDVGIRTINSNQSPENPCGHKCSVVIRKRKGKKFFKTMETLKSVNGVYLVGAKVRRLFELECIKTFY